MRVKDSRERRETQYDEMTDEQLGNVAGTLVYITMGPRALHALATLILLQRRGKHP